MSDGTRLARALAPALVLACTAGAVDTGAPGAPAVPALPAEGAPAVAGCPVFPPDDPWNVDVSTAPIHPESDRILAAIGLDAPLRFGFGAAEEHFGIPYTVVPADQPAVEIVFGTDGVSYAHESDAGPMPIPLDAPIQGGSRAAPDPAGGDRHVVVVQEGTCLLFELYAAQRMPGGFRVTSAVRWDLRRTPARPPGWTSADGAGLPIFPGLLRWDEVAAGRVAHALRFTAPRVRAGWVPPANHCGPDRDPAAPPSGTRVRLRADFDLAPYTGVARTVLEALQRHGMILADRGTAWTVGGSSHPGFEELFRQLRARPVPGRAFEVVASGPLREDC